ncbi:hypothetical protein HDK90DRAFT_209600 [Phyllosticta capitalensis]|uniref:Mid2 domain-containing protein n=1 Tax=Phyllosticta capitalensis TaxID=121624 RepID=A0ABR1YSW1_9PEZI
MCHEREGTLAGGGNLLVNTPGPSNSQFSLGPTSSSSILHRHHNSLNTRPTSSATANMWLAYLCLILIGLARSAVADAPKNSVIPNDQNYFLYPGPEVANGNYSDNKVVSVGETMPLAWVTVFYEYEISLWQVLPDLYTVERRLSLYNFTGSTGHGQVSGRWRNWTLESSIIDMSPVFFFWGIPDNETESSSAFISHFFNITDSGAPSDPTSTTTDASNLSNSSPSTVTITLRPTGSLDTHTSIVDPTAAASSGLSGSTSTAVANGTHNPDAESDPTESRLGLGLGIGLGVPILLILGIVIGVAVYKRRTSSQADVESDTSPSDQNTPSTDSSTSPAAMPEPKSRPASSFVSTLARRPASSLVSAFLRKPEPSPVSPYVVSPCDVRSTGPASAHPISELRGSEIYELPANESKAELP